MPVTEDVDSAPEHVEAKDAVEAEVFLRHREERNRRVVIGMQRGGGGSLFEGKKVV